MREARITMVSSARSAKKRVATTRKTRARNDAVPRERHFVNGLAKGLSIIQAFDAETPVLTLVEAATRTELTRASARRILMTLEDLGFVTRQGERHFILTPKVLSLGYAYLSSMPLWTFAEPILEQLVEQLGETCSISVIDDTELVYVLRIPVHRILSQGVAIGSRLPLYCHSAGRVLLSGLSAGQLDAFFQRATLKAFTPRTVVDPAKLRKLIAEVSRSGHAWINGEMEDNISGLSVPIRQSDGRIIAALNASVNQPSVKEQATVKRLLPALKQAADRLSASLAVGGSQAIGARRKGRGHDPA